MVHDHGSILPDVQLGKILSPASFLLLQKWKESLSWTDPCGLFHWAQPGITDSVLLLPLAMPSYLIHRLLLSWQQRQPGDTGSIIVTLVSTQQTHTHTGGTGYTKDCIILCNQSEFIHTVLLVSTPLLLKLNLSGIRKWLYLFVLHTVPLPKKLGHCVKCK